MIQEHLPPEYLPSKKKKQKKRLYGYLPPTPTPIPPTPRQLKMQPGHLPPELISVMDVCIPPPPIPVTFVSKCLFQKEIFAPTHHPPPPDTSRAKQR